MAENIVFVDPEKFKRASIDSATIADNTLANLQKLRNGSGSVRWDGEAARAYQQLMAAKLPILEKLERTLRQGSETVKRAGIGFADHDQTGASQVTAQGQTDGQPAGGGGSIKQALA